MKKSYTILAIIAIIVVAIYVMLPKERFAETVFPLGDGAEVSASTVFAEVDKNNCILYVPLNSADKYRTAEGWGEFENIVEMKSNKPGDANNDGEVDGKDVDATVGYIMEGKTDSFIFKNADVKADCKINAADIVKITNIITEKK